MLIRLQKYKKNMENSMKNLVISEFICNFAIQIDVYQ